MNPTGAQLCSPSLPRLRDPLPRPAPRTWAERTAVSSASTGLAPPSSMSAGVNADTAWASTCDIAYRGEWCARGGSVQTVDQWPAQNPSVVLRAQGRAGSMRKQLLDGRLRPSFRPMCHVALPLAVRRHPCCQWRAVTMRRMWMGDSLHLRRHPRRPSHLPSRPSGWHAR